MQRAQRRRPTIGVAIVDRAERNTFRDGIRGSFVAAGHPSAMRASLHVRVSSPSLPSPVPKRLAKGDERGGTEIARGTSGMEQTERGGTGWGTDRRKRQVERRTATCQPRVIRISRSSLLPLPLRCRRSLR